MGSDCPANRECHDSAHASISELWIGAAAARRLGLRNRVDLSGGATTRAVLQEALFPLRQYHGDSAADPRLSLPQQWDRRQRQSAQWKRLCESPEYFAFERR